jgi:succinate dehydrogenase / fumarate reductase flavoprotein subunit
MQVRLDAIPAVPDELKAAIQAEANGQLPEELK